MKGQQKLPLPQPLPFASLNQLNFAFEQTWILKLSFSNLNDENITEFLVRRNITEHTRSLRIFRVHLTKGVPSKRALFCKNLQEKSFTICQHLWRIFAIFTTFICT